MNRKGFELSVNMIVVIILSLVLFGVGMILFTNVIDKGMNLEGRMTQQMQDQLNAAMDDGSLIVVPIQRVTVNRGDTATFSFGFWNELEVADFEVHLENYNQSIFDTVAYVQNYSQVKQNEKVRGLIAIKVPKSAPKGQYSFDLEVQREGLTYTGHKNRIYIVVP